MVNHNASAPTKATDAMVAASRETIIAMAPPPQTIAGASSPSGSSRARTCRLNGTLKGRGSVPERRSRTSAAIASTSMTEIATA